MHRLWTVRLGQSAMAVMLAGGMLWLASDPLGAGQPPAEKFADRARRMSAEWESRGLAEPFKGITSNGSVVPNLFTVKSTGVSTDGARNAASTLLAALGPEQRKRASFPIDDAEWRKWMNQHFYRRQGVGFDEMSEPQREAAFGLLRASLSAKGLTLTRDIMKLNHTLGELNQNNFEEYGEWLYWITVMGTPSPTEPWGWQLDGHHAIINYFVLGDQVVMTPAFFGSEPITAKSGKYAGTTILQDEIAKGLAFVNALTEPQRKRAVLQISKTGNNILTEAFKDNVVLDFAGLPGAELTADQQTGLLDLARLYIGNMDDGHAKVKMEEVRQHLDATYFAWIGGTSADSVFYYRIHSPVVLIEFDQQTPIGLRHLMDPRTPTREHIHTVTRTPNANDYGKDLLRQHYMTHPHTPSAANGQ